MFTILHTRLVYLSALVTVLRMGSEDFGISCCERRSATARFPPPFDSFDMSL